MAQLPYNLGEILSAVKIRIQLLASARELGRVLGPSKDDLGRAYEICQCWQRRLELALRSEIPEWTGLAGFRSSIDFAMDYGTFTKTMGPLEELDPKLQEEVKKSKTVDSVEKCLHLVDAYFREKKDLHSGKVILEGDTATKFIEILDQCTAMPGGQSGNILWVWRCIGARAIAYMPYLASRFFALHENFPVLEDLLIMSVEERTAQCNPFKKSTDRLGVRKIIGRAHAPLGGAITLVKDGRRLIFGIKGNRDLENRANSMPWNSVVFSHNGQQLHETPIQRHEQSDPLSWPSIGFFADIHIDNGTKTLHIRLLDDEELADQLSLKVDFAVLGAMNCIYYDPWYSDELFRFKVQEIIKSQLRTLRKRGVRIGVELSGFPEKEFVQFLQEVCKEGTIVVLGINGVDELPDVTGARMRDELHMSELALDMKNVPDELKKQAGEREAGANFEYITYLRAKRLAEATGVRTLYIHTLTLDMILRKDADPGSLLRAQMGDMMSKGLVIAALLQRSYPNNWSQVVRSKMPPAVKPEAMAKLGTFAMDFEKHEKSVPGAAYHILRNGYWLASSPEGYSVAVVPVVWPHVDDHAVDSGLPEMLNTTGSGDMTFGTFLFLAGV